MQEVTVSSAKFMSTVVNKLVTVTSACSSTVLCHCIVAFPSLTVGTLRLISLGDVV